jgi:hypothetical protein
MLRPVQKLRLIPALLLAAATEAAAPPALAEPTPEARAAAETLYNEAGKLGDAGKWTEAMAKLEASLALDPAVGTLQRLAYCAEKLGLTATAWSRYLDMEALATQSGDKRAKFAAANAKRLEPLLAKLSIEVPPESRGDDLEIRKDGTPLKPGAWGVPVPVDPGPHTVEASRPGKQAFRTMVTVEAKPGVTSVRVPVLPDVPATPAAPEPAPPFWGSRRIAGVSVAGAGVVGIAIGAALGAVALKKASDLKSSGQCNADLSACFAAGMSAWQDGRTLAHGSTAAFVVGGAAVAVGVVLFATGGAGSGASAGASGARVTVRAIGGARMGGVSVKGGW